MSNPNESAPLPSSKEYYEKLNELGIKTTIGHLKTTITRESGNVLFCDCPQHASTSHESLHVNLDTQQWYCFACGVGGDSLQLVEFTHHGVVTKGMKGQMSETHRQARDWLAAKNGMPPLNEASMSTEQLTEWRKKLHEANRVYGCLTEFAKFCSNQLIYNPNRDIITKLLTNYAISEETIKQQMIGYSVIVGAVEYLEAHGYTHDEMIACGAFKSNSQDYPTPRFKFRYTFPYWKNGRVEYLIGRETENTPKYEKGDAQKRGSKYYKLPTRNDDPKGNRRNISPLISNNILWNEQILDTKPENVIISEGITDALSAHSRGFPVISPITTYIPNDDQERIIEKIKKLKIQPYICLDNEVSKIGYEAALKMADMFEFNGVKAPKIIILPLTNEQIAAKEEIKTRFGIDDTLTKKQISEKEKHLIQEDRKEYERLCSIAKQDINSYFIAFPEAEGFQKLIDTAQTQHRIKLEAYRSRLESKDIDLLDDEGFLTAMKRAEKFDVKSHTIFMELATKAKLKAPLKKTLKEHDVPAAHFKEEKSSSLSDSLTAAGVSVPEGCLALKVPANYQFSTRGIEFVKKGQAFTKVELVSKYPLLIKRRIRDIATGMISLEILTHDNKGWRSIIAPRSVAFDKGKITKLADVGLWTSPDSLGFLVKYLHDFEAANDEVLSVDAVSSQLGWIEPGLNTFLYGNTCMGNDNIKFVPNDTGDAQLSEGLTPTGDIEKWLAVAQKAMQYPYVAIMTYAALTAPILRILDITTFFVDLAAPTSSGKSIALRFAMSTFGNPRQITRNWNTTVVGIERAISTQKDIPLAMDDTKGGPVQQFSKMAYHLTNEIGKIRGSRQGSAAVLHWKTVILSTGEASFADYMTDGGARSRVVALKGYPFHQTNTETRKLVAEIESVSSRNYGHIGKKWIEYIIANRDKWEAWKEEYYQDNQNFSAVESGIEGRFINFRTAISFTARKLHESGILPWELSDPFDAVPEEDCLYSQTIGEAISESSKESDIGLRSLISTWNWIISNQEKFYGQHEVISVTHHGNTEYSDKVPPGGWLGKWDDTDDWKGVAIFPEELDQFLIKNGYDAKACRTAWKQKKWIEISGRGDTKAVRIKDRVTRMIFISRHAIEAAVMGEQPAFSEISHLGVEGTTAVRLSGTGDETAPLGQDQSGSLSQLPDQPVQKIIDFSKFLKRLDRKYEQIQAEENV